MTAIGLPTRFVIVGLVCAAAHNAIMIAADWWQIHYALSSVLSYAIVVVLGFALHVGYTFGQSPSFASFGRYALAMAANYPFTLALLFVMCDLAGWPVAVAAPVATVMMMLWNFLASRWAIVRQPQNTELGVPPPTSSSRSQ